MSFLRRLPHALPPALTLSILVSLAHAGTTPMPRSAAAGVTQSPAPTAVPSPASVVRVNSTNQPYDFLRPWLKRAPFSRRGVGAVLSDGRVLITADLVANHSYVELEQTESSAKSPATVDIVDYDCNLAIIRPQDPEFLKDAIPLDLGGSARVGDRVEVVQLENNGAIAVTPAVITTITIANYPADGIGLLTFKLSAPLQYRDNSYTLPILRDGHLEGMLMRYDIRSQTAEVVPEPVIANFLFRAAQDPFPRIPKAGMAFSPTRDPQLRRYLGLNGHPGGVFVSNVLDGTAAQRAGLQRGDVILKVAGNPIDQDGNYQPPLYGRISFSHLISSETAPGTKLPLTVLRDGTPVELDMELAPRDPESIVSDSYILDRAPRYYVLGGLLFQELSRPYLREWGGDWRSNAPSRLAYLDEFQDELPKGRGKIVFLNNVLPSDLTVGYEGLSQQVITKINDVEIKRLEDIDAAAAKPVDGFHKIEFESDPGVIYLDAKRVEEMAPEIQRQYGLPSLQNL
jgi:hypothetical protein